MQDLYETNLKKLETWKRIFFMMFFFVIAGLLRIVLWVVVLLQIVTVLITSNPNRHVLGFGRSLSAYMYHLLMFLTFNTDALPFPFSPWRNLADINNSHSFD